MFYFHPLPLKYHTIFNKYANIFSLTYTTIVVMIIAITQEINFNFNQTPPNIFFDSS